MGPLFLLLVIIGFILTNLPMKLGMLRGHGSLSLTAALFWIASLLSLVFLLVSGQPLHLSGTVVGLAVAGGIGGAAAYFCFINALRIGHYALTISVLTMSFLLPVLYSTLFWGIPLKALAAAGIVLIVAGIVLISFSGSAQQTAERKNRWKWLLWISAAFCLNGIPQVSQAAAVRLGGVSYWLYLFIVFFSGGLVYAVVLGVRRISVPGKAWTFAAVAAVASVAANLLTLKTLETIPAMVVFPVTLTGPVIGGVLVSRFVFREKMDGTAWFGILAGICGLVLLALR
jgi:uncharacterized membrane protein